VRHAGAFYDSMLDYIEQFPEAALGIGAAQGAEAGAQSGMRIVPGTMEPAAGPADPAGGWFPPRGWPLPHPGQTRPLGPAASASARGFQ
jgi:hypothetical protein